MNENAITQELLAFGKTVKPEELFPTLTDEANPILSDPYAFALACALDRGTKSEIIWTLPYYLEKELGHLDPKLIIQMSLEELANVFERLPKKPRYVNDAPKTVYDLTRLVVNECNGDAANIWENKRASQVKKTYMSLHGVGPGIANMTVLLIEKRFGIRFDDLERSHMDIKTDVHTVRVLYRLGVSDGKDTESATYAARRLNPSFPGEIDAALWKIGKTYCFASNPDCQNCPMKAICSKIFD